MESYFSKNGVRLFLGDIVKTLEQLPEESIDLIFADPPYNLSNGGFTCHAGKRVSVNKGKWDKSQGIESDFQFHDEWIKACKRVLKPNGSLWISGTYHSIYACGYILQKKGWHIINNICWYKPNAAPNLSCRMFTASHETLLWVRKDKKAKHTFNYNAMKTLAQVIENTDELSLFTDGERRYAKNIEQLQSRLDVHWILHNFVCKHFTTKEVPAMALGVLKKAFSVVELFKIQIATPRA